MRRIKCCKKYGFKKGSYKKCFAAGSLACLYGDWNCYKNWGAEKKGVEKERGYDPRRNLLLVKLIRISFT